MERERVVAPCHLDEWEPPQAHEVGVSAEVTAYVATAPWDDGN